MLGQDVLASKWNEHVLTRHPLMVRTTEKSGEREEELVTEGEQVERWEEKRGEWPARVGSDV